MLILDTSSSSGGALTYSWDSAGIVISLMIFRMWQFTLWYMSYYHAHQAICYMIVT